MTLTVELVARMQCEIMSGSTWERRTDHVPDTAEAREMWDRLSASVAERVAAGHRIDVLSD